MKSTYDEAEAAIKSAFGSGEKIPRICFAGPELEYDPGKADFSKEGDSLYIHDSGNETVWAIDLKTGCVQHRGTGRGCFWTEPEKWFCVGGEP